MCSLIKGETYYAIIGHGTTHEQATAVALEIATKHECSIIVVDSISEIPLDKRPRPIIRRNPEDLILTCELNTRPFEWDSKESYKGHEKPYKYHK